MIGSKNRIRNMVTVQPSEVGASRSEGGQGGWFGDNELGFWIYWRTWHLPTIFAHPPIFPVTSLGVGINS